ncbi:acyl transferase/acyl hydrolase/lysophospholipase [Dactylonectria estremocensis]|uniref:Acyl transferase/acyl hydrolase/lysophospholipase n=1 Tax=Dactylonectria estremocensis TaxID=1079267 RepID=A0A9P9JI69_9HYPO|nr:acyl transferase/acyl hydrolase/lysophospholipase [Dactylonectria estremocensis]
MEHVRQEKGLEEVPKPCDHFDLIGGTSTGGIIAIMLGRLGMTVDECIHAYKKVAQQAFTPKRTAIFPASPSGAFSATQLENAIRQTIRDHCVQPECVEQNKRGTTPAETCSHDDVHFRDSSCTKTVVLAITKDNVDALPTLFTTYDTSTGLEECTIWQVARATSAATTFFKPIRVGRDDIEFVDAGFGYNNPCEVLITEAKKQFPSRDEMRVISIGTGLGDVVAIGKTRTSILKALKKMATTSKKVAPRLDEELGDGGTYFRFNVDRGLEDVTLSDWEKSSNISSHTRNYLNENRRAIKKCVDSISNTTGAAEDVGGTQCRATHHIPFPKNTDFVERTDVLDTLRKILFSQIATHQVALVGLGGMGKTQVALHLAHWTKDNKPGYSVFWMPAFSLASFEQACTELTKKLGIRCAEDDDAKVSMQQYLGSKEAGSWLLIIDNIDEMVVLDGSPQEFGGILDFLPQSDDGRTLFTTRSREVAVTAVGDTVVKLSEMNQEEATSFLAKSLIHKEQLQLEEAVTELLARLTNLPLAIAQAAAYLNMNQVSITEYLRLFKNTDKDMIELLSSRFRDCTHYHRTQGAVATTWTISFNQIHEHDRPAASLLSFIAFTEPKAIPRSLLPALETEQQLTRAIGTLCGYGFLSQRDDDEIYDMHSLVHLATQAWSEDQDDADKSRQEALAHLTDVFPTDEWENRELWRQYLPHSLRALEMRGGIDSKGCDLGYWVGRCLFEDGRILEAVRLLKQVVAIQETQLAEDDPDLLSSQHQLAVTYQANGQVKAAVQLLEHIVAIELKLAEDHPSRLASQHELARVYVAAGQVERGRRLLKHVVAIKEKVLAEDHPSRLQSEKLLQYFHSTYISAD